MRHWLGSSFTGCGTVSAFAGKGKKGTLKFLKSKEDARRAFRELGQSWTVSEDLFILLERFTCSMYMSVDNTTGCVNDARYKLFYAKNGEVESHQLPLQGNTSYISMYMYMYMSLCTCQWTTPLGVWMMHGTSYFMQKMGKWSRTSYPCKETHLTCKLPSRLAEHNCFHAIFVFLFGVRYQVRMNI